MLVHLQKLTLPIAAVSFGWTRAALGDRSCGVKNHCDANSTIDAKLNPRYVSFGLSNHKGYDNKEND